MTVSTLVATSHCGDGCACSAAPALELGPPDAVYTTRGQVKHVPDGMRDAEKIIVHHERIADFKDKSGAVVGMASMSMGFAVDATQLPEGLKAGMPVELSFEVRWGGAVPLRIRQLKTLPEGTVLELKAMPSL